MLLSVGSLFTCSSSSLDGQLNGPLVATILTQFVSVFQRSLLKKYSLDCSSKLEDQRCVNEMGATNSSEFAFFYNRSCHYGTDHMLIHERDLFYNTTMPPVSPAEEFFERYVLEKTASIDETGGFNIKVVMALAFAWILTCLVLVKGVKGLGYLCDVIEFCFSYGKDFDVYRHYSICNYCFDVYSRCDITWSKTRPGLLPV